MGSSRKREALRKNTGTFSRKHNPKEIKKNRPYKERRYPVKAGMYQTPSTKIRVSTAESNGS